MIKLRELNEVDEWSRPLYKDIAGDYYCDTNLGKNPDHPDIHYKGCKDCEPDFRIKNFKIINDTY
jgi:hypothetical protein